jgi:glycosyltransferase involved in cell wall biosynthesis
MSDSKARVCIIRHGYFPQDPRVRKEARALLEDSHQVDIICLRNMGEQPFETWEGAEVHRLPIRHKRKGLFRYMFEYTSFFVLALFKVSLLHIRKRYSVVQVNTMPDFLVFAAVFPRLMGAKIVLDMHELMPEFFQTKFDRLPARILLVAVFFLEKKAIQFSDRTVTVSPVTAAVLQRRHSRTFQIVHNTPDESLFACGGCSGPSHESQGYVLVTHGTITHNYGIDVLVRAMTLIIEEVPDARAYIIGDGEYLPELRRVVSSLNLRDSVILPGRIPLEAVSAYVSQAHIGIVTLPVDGYMEFLAPNKLFEYVALKKPVVAADVPGVRAYFDESAVEFFEHNNVQDLAHKVAALLKDPERQQEMVSSAWKVYERVRWMRTKEIYKEIVTFASS